MLRRPRLRRTNAKPVAVGYAFNHVANTFADLGGIPVWLNGSHPDGDALTFRVTTKPRFGTLHDRNLADENQSKRALCYTACGFNRSTIRDFSDQIVFTASDPYGATSSPATVRIFVDERIP